MNSGFRCEKVDYDNCIYGTVTRMMKDEVGCTVPYVLDNDNICETTEDSNKAYDIHRNHITNQENTCPSPCKCN